MRTVFLLLVLTLPLAPTLAKDVDGEFAVFSVGGDSCLRYVRARTARGEAERRYSEWIQGYLSAFNLIVSNTYDILGARGFDKAMAWLDEYCQEYPDETFVNAAALLTVNLFPLRTNLAPNKDSRGKWSDRVSQQ